MTKALEGKGACDRWPSIKSVLTRGQSAMSGLPTHSARPRETSGLAALRQFLAPCTLGLSQQNLLGSMTDPAVLGARPHAPFG